MAITQQIAKHFREAYDGGNWTGSNLKDAVNGVSWEQAVQKADGLNSIAALVFHINYYVDLIIKVLERKPLEGHDKYSFNLPPLQSSNDWEDLLNKAWANAEKFVKLVEQLPDEKLSDTFAVEKYGNYYRNLEGVIQHTHYHLGQIVVIKKLILQGKGY
jgi:uncharacterized damage-inducible protein DinB